MHPAELDARRDLALRLARDAGALAQSYLASPSTLDVRFKRAQEVVTVADAAVERMIVAALAAAFPADRVLGEEGGGDAGAGPAGALWVIDPIDGTANFARGLPHWCVSIALVVGGRTELGVIADPSGGRLYCAMRGSGAFCNDTRLGVSGVGDATRAMVDVGYAARTPAAAFAGLVGELLARGVAVTQCGSAALGLARVADGRIDGYAERHLHAWDVLAGLLLVEEAGGRVNDFLAGDALLRGNAAIASTPALYPLLEGALGAH